MRTRNRLVSVDPYRRPLPGFNATEQQTAHFPVLAPGCVRRNTLGGESTHVNRNRRFLRLPFEIPEFYRIQSSRPAAVVIFSGCHRYTSTLTVRACQVRRRTDESGSP